MMKFFDKTVEIYDGYWSYHFICPLGAIINSLAFDFSFIIAVY